MKKTLFLQQIRLCAAMLVASSMLLSALIPRVVVAFENDVSPDIDLEWKDLGGVAGVIISHTDVADLSRVKLLTFPEVEEPKPVMLAYAARSVYRVPESHLDPLFNQYGEAYGVPPETLKKIAYCESGYNTNSQGGPYGGMYQYLDSTWASTRRAMGMSEDQELKYDPEEAIRTSAWKIANGGIGAWPVCGRR